MTTPTNNTSSNKSPYKIDWLDYWTKAIITWAVVSFILLPLDIETMKGAKENGEAVFPPLITLWTIAFVLGAPLKAWGKRENSTRKEREAEIERKEQERKAERQKRWEEWVDQCREWHEQGVLHFTENCPFCPSCKCNYR